MNKELEEAIKFLEEERNNYIEASKCGLGYPSDNREHKEKAHKIETVLKELERLQEENNKLVRANKIYINSIQNITPVLLENYIEKDQIREKLEELQKQYKEALEENSTKAFILKCQIEILEKY